MKKIAVALLLFVIGVAAYLLHFEAVTEPELPGELAERKIEWDGYQRSYSFYVPSRPAKNPALVFVAHGSGGSVERVRGAFGYVFEQLAEEHGFYVVYPEGYEQHFNGCRRAGPYEANTLQVDDVGFVRLIVRTFIDEFHVNQNAVFATGISNGGQLALRLALEAPELVTAVAPVATSLPSEDNMDCNAMGEAVAFLLMNGTDDPMNPYSGGTVALYGVLGNRGTVISSVDTVAYWAKLAGHTQDPETISLPDRVSADQSTVEVRLWQAPGRKSVALYTIVGGGHNAPHPDMQLPRLLGGSNKDIVAAEEIWRFFQQALAQSTFQLRSNW